MSRYILSAVVLAMLPWSGGCAPRSRVIEVHAPMDARGQFLERSRLLFKVKDGDHKYDVLIGPLDEKRSIGSVYFRQSEITVGVTDAWIYIAGHYPRGETRLVNAGATGTTMIMVSDTDKKFDRVIFLCADGDEEVLVTSRFPVTSGNKWRSLKRRWHYVDAHEVDGKVEFGPVKRIPRAGEDDPDGILTLLEKINEARQQAGRPGWCDPPA